MPRRRSFLTAVRHYFLLLASVAIFASISWGLARQLMKKYSVNDELNRLQSEAMRIERENEELQTFIEYTKTDQFIEKEARLKKGLKALDEDVVVIRGMNVASQQMTLTTDDERSNAQKWLDYIIRGSE